MAKVGSFEVERLIVHQFDPQRPTPGGIDTCLRGMLKYKPAGTEIAVVGVVADGDSSRTLGVWEEHDLGGGAFRFMPVANLDPNDQVRRIPHSVRLIAGMLRFGVRSKVRPALVQAHRVDTATAVHQVFASRRFTYFIHTQQTGLTSGSTDSFWKHASNVHHRLEQRLISAADSTIIFNPTFGESAQHLSTRTHSLPTWYDEALFFPATERSTTNRVVWVGRAEKPKDPMLALDAFAALRRLDGASDWKFDLVGAGSLLDECQAHVRALRLEDDVILHGRRTPEDTAKIMREGRVFLMTSHPGYEGFPRVLVEALASGLPAAVTDGSDTGALVATGSNGASVSTRSADDLARGIMTASTCAPERARSSVNELSASTIIPRLFQLTSGDGLPSESHPSPKSPEGS